jgi:membrane AbrB-like protein
VLILGSLCTAFVAGVLARALRFPGGPIVGSMLATAVVAVQFGGIQTTAGMRLTMVVGLGTLLGVSVDRATLRALPSVFLPALLASVLLVLAGVGVTLLLRALELAPNADLLATSPGALSVLSVAAVEAGLDAPTVAMYHILRIMLVIGLLPVLIRMLPKVRSERALRTSTRAQRRAARADGPSLVPRFLRRLRPLPLPVPRPTFKQVIPLLPITIGSALGGLLITRLGIGALIVGTFLGATLVTVLVPWQVYRPKSFSFVVQCGLGWLIGTLVTAETVSSLRASFLGAVISAVLLVIAGFGITLLLRALGIAPAGDVLATSPGGLEVLVSTADEQGVGPIQVVVFHTMRLVVVIIALPWMLEALP